MGSILRKILPVKLVLVLMLMPMIALFQFANVSQVQASGILVDQPCYLTSSFSQINSNRSHDNSNGNGNYSVDLGANERKPMVGSVEKIYQTCFGNRALASISGVITKRESGNDGLGNRIEITNSSTGVKVQYGHVANFNVSLNQVVTVGQDIGQIGSTGNTGGFIHIHFTVFQNGQKQPYSNWTFGRPISPVVSCKTDGSCPVYRFHDARMKRHFYTMNATEKNDLEANNPKWRFETVAYFAHPSQVQGTNSVHRFWSASKQSHFYTINEAEKNAIIANDPSWSYQGVAFYAYQTQATGTVPLYRFWSNAYQAHFFTNSEAEKNTIIATNPNWTYQGVAYYVKN